MPAPDNDKYPEMNEGTVPSGKRSMFKYGCEGEGSAGTNNYNDVVSSLLIAEFTRDPNSNCLMGTAVKSDGSLDLGADAWDPAGVGAEFRGKPYKSQVPRTTNANPDPGGGF
jgi:hypothetical protein